MKIIKGDFKNSGKAVQLSIDKLLQQGASVKINDSSPYSAMLLKLLGPYLGSTPHPDIMEDIIKSGIIAWNMAIIKSTGFPGFSKMYKDTLSEAGITKKGERIIKEIMQGKESEFAEHLNFIEDYEIYEAEDGMAHVNIISKTFTDFINNYTEEEQEFENMQYEEGYIDRNAVLVKPKPAFWDWLKKHDNDFVPPSPPHENTIYLIHEKDSDKATTAWLKKNFDKIFVNELEGWVTYPELWPQKRTYKMFTDFFETEYHSMIMDLENEPVSKE
ncbi:MAG: hypothetical protein ACSLE0_06790 [Chitinophagaceae bacterium]